MMKWLRSILGWIKNLFAKKTMRRKISLYIADQQVDLDDQSFILFNYTMEDLSNPTIVKNSYSQQITLKGTPTNNRVFGASFRSDRRVANMGGNSGVDFNASQKTPFTIYNEMNEILESGYVKLDSVSRNGADVQYKITLYGGLGSFFYALSYDENGNKRTLADLEYLDTGNSDSELNFTINRASILDAWWKLTGSASNVLSPSATYSGMGIDINGELVEDAAFNTKEYNVSRNGHILITGVSGGDVVLAAAYDASGNALRVYGAGADHVFTDHKVPVPDGAVMFRVQGDSQTGAVVKAYAPAMWDVINFAPAYNGIPDGNFSPDKALVVPSSVGLQDTINVGGEVQQVEVNGQMQNVLVGGVDYTLKAGYSLVNLAEAQDEWAVKDLRSYLQRPVLSMKAFWHAICNPDNNGGYVLDASVLQNYLTFGKYADLWMTLPMISSIGTIKQESGNLSLTQINMQSSGNVVGRYNIGGSVPSGTKVTANINCRVRFNMPSGADAHTELYRSVDYQSGRNTFGKFSVLFIQAVAYGSDNSIVGGSKIKVSGVPNQETGASIANACGFTPAWSADYEVISIDTFEKVSDGVFEIPSEIGFTIEAQDAAYYKILVSTYDGTTYMNMISAGHYYTRKEYAGNGSTSTPKMYVNYWTEFSPTSTYIVQGSANSVSYTTSENLRSGATITKSLLLSSSHTPAEYMLSFCKMFGLYFTYDVATRKVTIHKRNDLYQDETIDLTKRVDLSKGISIQPLVFNAKWYDFILEGVGGAFYDEYQNVEGIDYGIQRVNTGYDFNADSTNLMESVVFKNACTILARSKYFNYIFNGDVFQPSPFLDKGNTYTLWSSDGETLDTDISCPTIASIITYYNENPNFKGYDVNSSRKLELRDAANKPIDGADILVFLEGWDNYPYFKLTDDVPAMDVVNEGVPCWLLGAGGAGAYALYVPTFQRYSYGNISLIEDSLDFGIPRQFDIPGVRHNEGCTIYERGWKNYLADRYDVNTKVMTCRVNFAGIQVNQELLRKFYWYDNTLWVLNKIKNYSLTTFDPVECEFVQVQDKANYLTGQTY